MPLVCAVALHRRGDNFGAAICLAWMALSGIDASVYAYDAADPVLPLIGGGTGADSFHDFIFLFERYGQLHHARGWAMAIKALGVLGLYASLAWAGALALPAEREPGRTLAREMKNGPVVADPGRPAGADPKPTEASPRRGGPRRGRRCR